MNNFEKIGLVEISDLELKKIGGGKCPEHGEQCDPEAAEEAGEVVGNIIGLFWPF